MMKNCSGILFVILSAVGLLAAQPSLAAGDAAAGKNKIQVCVACHGQDGNSPAPMYPKLAGLGEKYLLKQMQDIKSGERNVPQMTGMLTNLSEQDLADIAAHYDSQNRTLAGAVEEDLTLGEQVYRGGNMETGVSACLGCHSPTGVGNDPAGYPALGGQFADYIASQLRAFRTGAHDPENPEARTNDGDATVMRGVAANMNNREIDAVANYIAGLHAREQ
jgi:cytochrome c553